MAPADRRERAGVCRMGWTSDCEVPWRSSCRSSVAAEPGLPATIKAAQRDVLPAAVVSTCTIPARSDTPPSLQPMWKACRDLTAGEATSDPAFRQQGAVRMAAGPHNLHDPGDRTRSAQHA